MQDSRATPASLRLKAVLQAVFVTVLWSTSWILIKFGLRNEIPALTFAGLRYTFAFLSLLPLVLFSKNQREAIKAFSPATIANLGLLGLFYYTLTQGGIFLSLAYLPAALLNLMLNLTTVVVGLAGVIFLRELPTRWQWLGVLVVVIGVCIYFLPLAVPRTQVLGLGVAGFCVLTNAIASLLGRQINRSLAAPPLAITFISMGFGSILLLIIGLCVQGFQKLAWQDWFIILWLALINTAFAFTLWNNTLRTLTAVESSILNSLMMPQVALLAFFFLAENLTLKEIIGLILVGVGVLVVQLRRKEPDG